MSKPYYSATRISRGFRQQIGIGQYALCAWVAVEGPNQRVILVIDSQQCRACGINSFKPEGATIHGRWHERSPVSRAYSVDISICGGSLTRPNVPTSVI